MKLTAPTYYYKGSSKLGHVAKTFHKLRSIIDTGKILLNISPVVSARRMGTFDRINKNWFSNMRNKPGSHPLSAKTTDTSSKAQEGTGLLTMYLTHHWFIPFQTLISKPESYPQEKGVPGDWI